MDPKNLLSQYFNMPWNKPVKVTPFSETLMSQRTLPGGQTYSAPTVVPTSPVPKAPATPIFTAPVQNAPAPATPPKGNIPPQYINPATGTLYSPEDFAANIAKAMPKGTLPKMAGDQAFQGPQTTEQLTSTAASLNNARNDLAVGQTDPYKAASASGIAYSPAQLAAIEKAYAGIYDPALQEVFAKLDQKQKEDAAALEAKQRLEEMAQQHKYDLELKQTPTYSDTHKEGSSVSNYNGEFKGTIDLVSSMEKTVAGKKAVAEQLKGLIASKDYATAYAQIANTVESEMTGVPKTKFMDARTDYAVMEGMKQAIKNYAAAGGNMGLLTGTEEEIKRKLGIDTPKASAIATQLWREFQVYRNNMTGAAFGAAESRDYASVNPALGKSLNLNLSVIEGAQKQLLNRVQSTINQRVPSAQYIYEYATGADKKTTPASSGASSDNDPMGIR